MGNKQETTIIITRWVIPPQCTVIKLKNITHLKTKETVYSGKFFKYNDLKKKITIYPGIVVKISLDAHNHKQILGVCNSFVNS